VIRPLLAATLLLVGGCSVAAPPPPLAVPPVATPTNVPAPPQQLVAPTGCHLRGTAPLPDPSCTPGVINPAVTPATLGITICKIGWTTTVRPPTSVTNRIKKDTDFAYGLPAGTKGELDHLISLELGGAPADPRNLWVEPGPIPNAKDAIENRLHTAVCSGQVSLGDAQHAIATDWTTALHVTGVQ